MQSRPERPASMTADNWTPAAEPRAELQIAVTSDHELRVVLEHYHRGAHNDCKDPRATAKTGFRYYFDCLACAQLIPTV